MSQPNDEPGSQLQDLPADALAAVFARAAADRHDRAALRLACRSLCRAVDAAHLGPIAVGDARRGLVAPGAVAARFPRAAALRLAVEARVEAPAGAEGVHGALPGAQLLDELALLDDGAWRGAVSVEGAPPDAATLRALAAAAPRLERLRLGDSEGPHYHSSNFAAAGPFESLAALAPLAPCLTQLEWAAALQPPPPGAGPAAAAPLCALTALRRLRVAAPLGEEGAAGQMLQSLAAAVQRLTRLTSLSLELLDPPDYSAEVAAGCRSLCASLNALTGLCRLELAWPSLLAHLRDCAPPLQLPSVTRLVLYPPAKRGDLIFERPHMTERRVRCIGRAFPALRNLNMPITSFLPQTAAGASALAALPNLGALSVGYAGLRTTAAAPALTRLVVLGGHWGGSGDVEAPALAELAMSDSYPDTIPVAPLARLPALRALHVMQHGLENDPQRALLAELPLAVASRLRRLRLAWGVEHGPSDLAWGLGELLPRCLSLEELAIDVQSRSRELMFWRSALGSGLSPEQLPSWDDAALSRLAGERIAGARPPRLAAVELRLAQGMVWSAAGGGGSGGFFGQPTRAGCVRLEERCAPWLAIWEVPPHDPDGDE
ncbi:hypothetical protein Rsub_05331 [Raphidocelis subcapitata]|uniref:F-box domain-containing protein n=1 Tax=Raphidocelis subcapitata TaxID=307507 RepID=A0A2V0NX80_9CHLO|nr:hypothetical protein Rsub_05331 [Raphidocelis subcapitata]|eukprot:GBF92248.1 hypothetical protein Rsub_05331 [Raphidocelis subcapitata]